MKLLRDVAKRSVPTSYEGWDSDDDENENGPNHGYWGEPEGAVECCGWSYSHHARITGLIRHHSYCINFNPQGLNEF